MEVIYEEERMLRATQRFIGVQNKASPDVTHVWGHKYAWFVYNKGGCLGLQQSSFFLRVFLNFSLLFQGRAKTGV